MAKAKTSVSSGKTKPNKWRVGATWLLLVLGSVFLIFSLATRWARDNILNTDNYVANISSLPKNDDVSNALAHYSVTQLFEGVNIEQKISDALPEKAGFLAAPLADRLQTKTIDIAHDFIVSDQFSSIWISANRAAQQSMLRIADSTPGQAQTRADQVSSAAVKLTDLVTKVKDRFDINQQFFSDNTQLSSKAGDLSINLKIRADQLRTTVKYIRRSAAVLPIVVLALILGAMALAYNRRRTWLLLGLLITLVGVITSVVLKATTQGFINSISNPDYRDGAHAILVALSGDLRTRVEIVIGSGLAILLFGWLAGPSSWAFAIRHMLRLDKFSSTRVGKFFASVRTQTKTHRSTILLAGAVGIIILLLVASTLSWALVIGFAALYAVYAESVVLISSSSPLQS